MRVVSTNRYDWCERLSSAETELAARPQGGKASEKEERDEFCCSWKVPFKNAFG